MEAKEQVFTKREIVGNLRALTKTAIELTRLLREDSKLLEPVAHSRRNLKELLLHLALIPREQILMLRGIERETISQGYAINSIKDFEKILSASVDFFVTEIKSVDLNRQYITPKKKKMSGLSWGIEALTHLRHIGIKSICILCLRKSSLLEHCLENSLQRILKCLRKPMQN